MSKELSPKYNPAEVEAGRYSKMAWCRCFQAFRRSKAKPLFDRYSTTKRNWETSPWSRLGHDSSGYHHPSKRMQGFDTLWLPGMDHAGIATRLGWDASGEGISRYDLGREKFRQGLGMERRICHYHQGTMGQDGLCRLPRERFTPWRRFVKRGSQGLCGPLQERLDLPWWVYHQLGPSSSHSPSDIEVIHKDVEGAFYHMNYMLEDGSRALKLRQLVLRPCLGTLRLAVNPEDPRYKDLIGKNVILPPLTNHSTVGGWARWIRGEFGTGVVKSHLPTIQTTSLLVNVITCYKLTSWTTMEPRNDLAFEFAGMDRFEARKAVVDKLEEIGPLLKSKTCPQCWSLRAYRRGGWTTLVSTQWFVKMDQLLRMPLPTKTLEDKVEFLPTSFQRYLPMDGKCPRLGNLSSALVGPTLLGTMLRVKYMSAKKPRRWRLTQDEDVLDTWFSSALWPFPTMGWPDVDSSRLQTLLNFNPGNRLRHHLLLCLVWSSNLEFTGRQPFQNVLSSMVSSWRAIDARCLNLSVTGFDPMDVIGSNMGADVSVGSSNGSVSGQDVRSLRKMDASWNLHYQASGTLSHILMNNEGLTPWASNRQCRKVTNKEAGDVTDRWIPPNFSEMIGIGYGKLWQVWAWCSWHILYNFIWMSSRTGTLSWPRKSLYSDNEEEKVITRSVLLYTLDKILCPSPNCHSHCGKSFWTNLRRLYRYSCHPTVNPALKTLRLTQAWKVLKTWSVPVHNARNGSKRCTKQSQSPSLRKTRTATWSL